MNRDDAQRTLERQCLIESLMDAVQARTEHDKARDEFTAGGGYSWGYHGHQYVERMEKAANDFGERLDAYVEWCIIHPCKKSTPS